MAIIPPALIASLNQVPGFNEQSFVEVHESGRQVTSIRLNPAKPTSREQSGFTQDAGAGNLLPEGTVPWCPTARYLSQRPSFTLDPSFHAGAYYVQDASSMFIDHILRHVYNNAEQPEAILDLCAAPGGKSTLLAARFPRAFIVSNEVVKSRVTILAENISKWGSDNVVVTHNNPNDFQQLPGFFNVVVVDAPCSGSGLFRKDERAINEWSEANVEMCCIRQQKILGDVMPSLRQNGYLIYSTCSYSKEENENICDWIVENLDAEPVKIPCNNDWGITQTFSDKYQVPSYRFYPDKVKGEGFFVACFRQVNRVDSYDEYAPDLNGINKTERSVVKPWLADINKFGFLKQKETIVAFPLLWEEKIKTVMHVLNVRKSGVGIGVIKGPDLIPHHELALSALCNGSIPFLELDRENALFYLKRKDMQLYATAKGWTLARYNGLNLGWVKVLSNRINNYYPTEWRILKD